MYHGDSLSIRSVWAAYAVDSGVPIAVLDPRRDRFSAYINGVHIQTRSSPVSFAALDAVIRTPWPGASCWNTGVGRPRTFSISRCGSAWLGVASGCAGSGQCYGGHRRLVLAWGDDRLKT